MKKVKVACVIYVEVEIGDDVDEIFVIEENGCPGTGVVFRALLDLLEKHENSSFCVMCTNQCTNHICPATIEVK